MTDADAVAKAVVTGVTPPDNPAPATQHNQTDGKAAAATDAWGTVDEPLRKVIEAKGWKAPVDALKSYIALEQYASKPVQDMNPEEREKFHKRLGRPESPDGIELSNVILPTGMQQNLEFNRNFRDLVWKSQALPLKEQAKHIHEFVVKDTVEKHEAVQKQITKIYEDSESELRKDWGLEYDANMAIANKAAKLGGDEFVQWLNIGPGKLAKVRKGLLAIGRLVSDEAFVNGRPVPLVQGTEAGMLFDPKKSPELTRK